MTNQQNPYGAPQPIAGAGQAPEAQPMTPYGATSSTQPSPQMQHDPQGQLYQGMPPATPQPQNEPPQGGISGLAVAGFVLGIIGLGTSFIPVINLASLFIGIVGVIMAGIGLSGINSGKHTGKGFAVAAITLNVITIVVMLLIQAACSAAFDSSSTSTGSNVASSQSAASSEQAQQAQSSASDAKYAVSIDGASETVDWNGKPAILVTLTWTNNSDEAVAFVSSLYTRCYQDGVELDTAIVTGSDSDGYLASVKPGASTTFQQAYELTSRSPVEVEVTELISFSKDVLASATFTLA